MTTKTKTKIEAHNWQVTRYCCTSGYCVDCHQRGNGLGVERRARIIHAVNLTRELALRMVAGWAAYDARASEMPAPAPTKGGTR